MTPFKLAMISLNLTAAVTLGGCGLLEPTVPIEVDLRLTEGINIDRYQPTVLETSAVITAIHEQNEPIEIQKVTINRGNSCTAMYFMRRHSNGDGYLAQLQFGQSTQVKARCLPEDIREIQVDTNQGSFSFNF